MYFYYSKCLGFIKNYTDKSGLYDGIRNILKEADNKGRYPEDWHIKTTQRAADAKYIELSEGEKK